MQGIIAENLGSVADEWSIKSTVVTCVHDCASTVKDASNLNGWLDVHCAAYKLQLCINNAMSMHRCDHYRNHPIFKCVSDASRLVGRFSYSPMAVGDLMKRQASIAKVNVYGQG